MGMKKYRIINLTLTDSVYHFAKPDPKLISITLNDSVRVIEIQEKEITLCVKRELNFGDGTDSCVSVEYEVRLESKIVETKESVLEALNAGVSELSVVFSRISLLVSQLTQASPIGVLVTAPNYNPKKAHIS